MPIVKNYNKLVFTPLGKAKADLIWIPDNSEEMSEYHCWQHETNEVWWWPQSLIRQVGSFTGKTHNQHSPIMLSSDLICSYKEHILRHVKSPFFQMLNGQVDARRYPSEKDKEKSKNSKD